jgi:hypothetical protein
MAKSSAKKKSATGTKRSSEKDDPQKVKALGNELRAELSALSNGLKAERNKSGTAAETKTIIDLKLMLLEDLQRDLLHVCWGVAVGPNPDYCCLGR